MSEEPFAVSVHILDKEYLVSCVPDEEAGLRETARMLDQRMREIRKTGRILGGDRIAVMAALNIIYELNRLQSGDIPPLAPDLDRRLGDLQRRLDTALAAQPRIDAPDESV
ncbi:MAG: cell division protein ZapA [Candidatus Thiosymbion ectosymbiont of Robbea hypermnestra]|nr:cell division protein ZapA [Candidatus Thiosymbion ectosymbiont of Robbea hypermnestra]